MTNTQALSVISPSNISGKPKIETFAGRPKTYDPIFCEMVIPFMARNHSLTAFAYKIKVDPKAVRNWVKQYPEFAEAVEIGRAGRTYALEVKLDDSGISGPAANIAWRLAKNVAPDEYQDKVEVAQTESAASLAIKQIQSTIAGLCGDTISQFQADQSNAEASIIEGEFVVESDDAESVMVESANDQSSSAQAKKNPADLNPPG